MLPQNSDVLLLTRLAVPRTDKGYLQRPRLEGHLQEAMQRQVVCVIAPAGSGKSTLLGHWCQHHASRVAWLSLESGDSDLRNFLQSFIAALSSAFGVALSGIRSLLDTPELPAHVRLVAALLDDLSAVHEAAVIVLDDYHVIRARPVHEYLITFVRYLPANFKLVISSRTDPPLPKSRMRVKGQLAELRMKDLQFDHDEARDFLRLQTGMDLPQDVSDEIANQTEGWAAGLVIAAISLRQQTDAKTVSRSLVNSNNRHVMNYLTAEVLSRQPASVRAFLIRTSILDRFSAPLCNALLRNFSGDAAGAGMPDAQAILRRIERANLFIIQLDDAHQWFRYHHLFQQNLRQQLEAHVAPAEIARLHQLAGQWLGQHGHIEAALRHLLKAGDLESAASLVVQNMRVVLSEEQWSVLSGWLRMLPAELIERTPGLLVAQAYINRFQWKMDSQPAVLKQAERCIERAGAGDDAMREMQGEIEMMWAELCRNVKDNAACLMHARAALDLLPERNKLARGLAMFYLTAGMQCEGRAAEAFDLLRREVEGAGELIDAYSWRLWFNWILLLLYDGEYQASRRIALHILQQARKQKGNLFLRWTCLLIGTACYELNELEQARTWFESALELGYPAHILSVHESFVGLALTLQALGQPAEADEVVARAYEYDMDRQIQSNLVKTASLQARLDLVRGAQASASHWARTSPPHSYYDLWQMLEISGVTRVMIFIAEGSTESLRAAGEVLDALLNEALANHSLRGQAIVHAHLGLWHWACGQPDQARAALAQSLRISEPNRAIRMYVDAGANMRALLMHMRDQGLFAGYIDMILGAFPAQTAAAQVDGSPNGTRKAAGPAHPLSFREIEVLRLIAQHMSNKEIAQKLVISELTVKTHAGNIYEKLGVKGRMAAVRAARDLRLLEDA
jgi:LuxR family maltose regulon positive regulatory protein